MQTVKFTFWVSGLFGKGNVILPHTAMCSPKSKLAITLIWGTWAWTTRITLNNKLTEMQLIKISMTAATSAQLLISHLRKKKMLTIYCMWLRPVRLQSDDQREWEQEKQQYYNQHKYNKYTVKKVGTLYCAYLIILMNCTKELKYHFSVFFG